MSRPKLIASAVLALLLLIVILQNTEAVETRILFLSFSLPRAILLFGTTLLGFVLGVIVAFRSGRHRTGGSGPSP